MNETCTEIEDGFLIRKEKATAGVEDDLESRGFKFEMAKRSSLMSPKLCSFTVNLETGNEPEYAKELTPIQVEKCRSVSLLNKRFS